MGPDQKKALRQQVIESGRPVAQIWPLKTFAYRNPVRGYENLPFAEAVQEAARVIGGAGFLSNSEYRDLRRQGRIKDKHLRHALGLACPQIDSDPVRAGGRLIEPDEVLWIQVTQGVEAPGKPVLEWHAKADGRSELLEASMAACESLDRDPEGPAGGADLPSWRTLSDWVGTLAGSSVVEPINEQMVKWSAAFLDEGMAGWGMPLRSEGFYRSWRDLAPRDRSGRFLGIRRFASKVRALPESPEEAIALGLDRLEIPRERWVDYQARMLAQLPGWAGFIRWRSENPQYPGQREHPVDLAEYLAVRLFYEAELVGAVCRRALGVAGTLSGVRSYARQHPENPAGGDRPGPASSRLYLLAVRLGLTARQVRELSADGVRALLRWMDRLPEDRHGPVWLAAYEDSYAERILGKIAARRGGDRPSGERPRAQLLFCIDARSEPFRRHIEAQGPYETFGYAGFFGVPISHQAFDSHDRLALCPVLLKPGRAVDEEPRPGEEDPLERYASGTRWRRLGDDLFHDLKRNPVGAFMLVDALGILFSIGLAGKTLAHRPYGRLRAWVRSRFRNELKTHLPVDRIETGSRGPAGFTVEERATFVANGLRMIGLTERLARLVIVCGHGAESDNNPYAAAYNCGACGGAHGDPNARVFAAAANDPEVRGAIAAQGIEIPDDVRFVAGKHDTTTDRVTFYDQIDLPPSHAEDLRQLDADLVEAGAVQARERLAKLPGAPQGLKPPQAAIHVLGRSLDWANPRPEWGLSSNAAFLIGRRELTKGLDLESRVFLHSYDPSSDSDGGILERIMTAPLIVGEWINMEYYFSSVDPWVYGSGSKVIHNVVGGVGVMLGSQGDLQGGLPLQGVADGPRRYHEPMRLLAIIEAPTARISRIIQKHDVLQALFHNQWVNLVAFTPETNEFHRYSPDASWSGLPQKQAA